MLEQSGDVEYIGYSKDKSFIVENTFLRTENISEAKEIHFDGVVNHEGEINLQNLYLKRVRSTFACFNIFIPSKECMDQYYLKENDQESLISNNLNKYI